MMLTPREKEYLGLAVGCSFNVVETKAQPCADSEETHIVINAQLEGDLDQSAILSGF
jgi:hypothetical protein